MVTYPKSNYIIGSGYCASDRYPTHTFARIWYDQIYKFTNPAQIFIALHDVENGMIPRVLSSTNLITLLPVANLGHIHQLVGDMDPHKSHQLCGWSASVLMLAMIAYNCERDFFYIEQDCLIFGDVIGQTYKEAGNRDMMFGSCKIMNAAQSFFFVRHAFIPIFVQRYLMGPSDQDQRSRPEKKFVDLEKSMPHKVGRFSFGCDRDRPMPWEAPIWYAQQWTMEELREATTRGVL